MSATAWRGRSASHCACSSPRWQPLQPRVCRRHTSEAIGLLPLAYASLVMSDMLWTLLDGQPWLLRGAGAALVGAVLGLVWPGVVWIRVTGGGLGLVALFAILGGAVAGRVVHGVRGDGDKLFDPTATLLAVTGALAVRVWTSSSIRALASSESVKYRRSCGTPPIVSGVLARRTPGHGRLRGHDRRRRWARGARVQPRPGDLPGDRAHGARSPSSRSSSTTSPSGTASCARCATGRRRSSAGPRACTRASSLATREKGGGDAFYQKRVPKGAPDYVETARIKFPSGRHADEICPTEIAVVGWARRWARSPSTRGRCAATTSTTPTSCASTSTRSRAPTSPTPCASPARRASCSTSSATPASRRPRAAAASTSTCGSSRAGRSPTCGTPRSPSAASSSGGCRAR